MDYILQTNKLTKIYKKQKVVNNVNLNIKKGEIYGLLGPNGAGKSTILKMILNLVTEDEGQIIIFNEKITKNNYGFLKRIGSIIENPYFYDKLTGKENLELHSTYMGYKNKERINEVLKLVDLHDIENKEVCNYSLGMKQKLAIARAILTNPEFLILDEPINGLDPKGIKEIRSLIKYLNKKCGMTIVISSHILSEIELLVDTVGIIKNGQLLNEISIDEIHNDNNKYIEIKVNNPNKAVCLIEKELKIKNYKITSENDIHIYDMKQPMHIISKLLVENDIQLEKIDKKESSLEDYFLNLIKENKYASAN